MGDRGSADGGGCCMKPDGSSEGSFSRRKEGPKTDGGCCNNTNGVIGKGITLYCIVYLSYLFLPFYTYHIIPFIPFSTFLYLSFYTSHIPLYAFLHISQYLSYLFLHFYTYHIIPFIYERLYLSYIQWLDMIGIPIIPITLHCIIPIGN